MEDRKITIDKIIIKHEDELVDVVRNLSSSKAEFIILKFPEESDLLISPINFKVIQKVADKLNKVIIAQVLQSSSGLANAKSAGLTTSNEQVVPDDLWLIAQEDTEKRKTEKKSALRGEKNPKKGDTEISKEEDPTKLANEIESEGFELSVQDLAEQEKATDENNLDSLDNQDALLNDIDLEEEETQIDSSDIGEVLHDENKTPKESDFMKKIDQTLSSLDSKNINLVEKDGFVLALDDDIENFVPPIEKDSEFTNEKLEDFDLEKKDTSEVSPATTKNINSKITDNIEQEPKSPTSSIQSRFSQIKKNIFKSKTLSDRKEPEFTEEASKIDDGQSTVSVQTSIQKNPLQDKSIKNLDENHIYHSFISRDFKNTSNIRNFKRRNQPTLNINTVSNSLKSFSAKFIRGKGVKSLLPFVFGLLIIAGIIFYFIYSITAQAKAVLYYESKEVSTERVFTGKNGSAFSLENSTVGVVLHEVEKESSESALVTGVGERGKKATGSVTLRCLKDATVNLPAGTKIKTSDNKEFKIVSTQNFTCTNGMMLSGVIVEALNYGSDYNIQSGTAFSIEGFASSDLNALNNTAFTGGTKETYKMVAKEDIDNITKALQETMNEEAKDELEEWGKTEGWVILPNTIQNKLDGDPQPDAPVNTETDIVNVVVKTVHTALYYNKKDLENAQNQIILDEAKNSALFGDVVDIENTDDISAEYTVIKEDKAGIEIKLILSTILKPEINQTEIENSLKGKNWKDGQEYLDSLSFQSRPAQLEFTPSWIPKFLWKFPSSKNKLILQIKDSRTQ